MTLQQLTEIIRKADKKAITKQLQELGYTYCNDDRKLGKVSVVDLVLAIKDATEDFADGQRKHLYNARICGTVKGYENYEFVFVNVYDIKPSTDPFDNEETAVQTEMLIWAKAVQLWQIIVVTTAPTANQQTTLWYVTVHIGVKLFIEQADAIDKGEIDYEI